MAVFLGKTGCIPLAFKCIKGSGGVVPSTLVGVTRIYPLLYRERYAKAHIRYFKTRSTFLTVLAFVVLYSFFVVLCFQGNRWGFCGEIREDGKQKDAIL